MIVIVDYRMGNVGSLLNMFRKIGAVATVSSDPAVIATASKLILPGVGAFDSGMANVAALGLTDILNQKALVERVPVLGICLGMQLLTRRSEEGRRAGLGWIDGETVRFRFDSNTHGLKVPHMGWNEVAPMHRENLFRDMDEDAGYYFVHSFHVVCDREDEVLARTQYGYSFASAVQRGNILGAQFHPEKSHRHGLRLLRNFASLS